MAARPLDQQWMAAAKMGAVAELKRCYEQDAALLTKQARGIGHTALHWSAAAGHLAAVTWLLDTGCPVGVRNAGDSTPLHSAAGMGQIAVVEELLKRGARAPRRPPRRTPRRPPRRPPHARRAARRTHAERNAARRPAIAPCVGVAALTIALLARRRATGADPKAGDDSGETAQQLAISRGHEEAAACILAAQK